MTSLFYMQPQLFHIHGICLQNRRCGKWDGFYALRSVQTHEAQLQADFLPCGPVWQAHSVKQLIFGHIIFSERPFKDRYVAGLCAGGLFGNGCEEV